MAVMDWGDLLTRWTVRLALSLYVASLVLRLTSRRPPPLAAARWAWTLGCGLYLLHVLCAFHFFHHWSQEAAYAATAQQTATLVGLNWGGGLYINYVFTLVWLVDAVWWWSPPVYLQRPWWVEWPVQGFLAFIAFNSTVVFATGAVRWAGAAASMLLLGLIAWAVCRVR
jgi:hypothetical protein